MISNISLEENGRIFPSWVMENFKKYILPKIIILEGEDPCKDTVIDKLTLYQQFIGQYLNFQSPFKDLLIYHGVGSGKTNTAINIYNILYNYTHKWNVFLLIPAALHDDPWLKDIKRWMSKSNYEQKLANITFIHYDSPFADKDFLKKVKEVNNNNNTSIFIIEESHRFINNVYNNISSKAGKRAQVIYNYIQQEKREKSNTRILLLSATPIINNPFEVSLIFNLLRPDILPISESIFEQLFLSNSNFSSLDENSKNMFQRRIMGLVSYYIGATPDKYAKKIIHYVSIPMDKYYEEVYDYYENIEKQKEIMRLKFSRGKKSNDQSTYSTYTRQACNFVFPNISSKINGEKRPRPSMFNVKDSDLHILNEDITTIKKKTELIEYIKNINIYIDSLIDYLNKINNLDNKYTIFDDINSFKSKYNFNFDTFYNSDDIKSNLLKELYKYSPKFIRMIFNILTTKGTVLIYSNYVIMEGLQILKIYLSFFGFINIELDKEFNKTSIKDTNNLKYDYCRYCEFHGKIDKETRLINKDIFNNKDNRYGKYCKIIMISSAGTEGISLSNVRQVHIIEPYWNEVRIEQVIGRAIRFCQHKDLPLNERIVDVYRYKMIKNDKNLTTDERIEDIARKKYILLLSFINAIKEVAVDCHLFKNHNMMGNEYTCFQFNEESLFLFPIEGAYKKNIEDDKKINNGLNATNSIIKRIKVYKIKAVKLINDNLYSSEEFYWFNDKTGIVYDYITYFPIGKILKDDFDNYNLLEPNLFIINIVINVPQYKLYE